MPALADDAVGLVELGLLRERVVTQVDRLCVGERGVAAPGLAPQPLLRQRTDGYLVSRVSTQSV